MLVDMVALRCAGEKRSAEAVRRARPVRAELSLVNQDGRTHACLSNAAGDSWLFDCRVHSISGADLVLHGRIPTGMYNDTRTSQHAWWCRVVNRHDPEGVPLGGPDL